MARSDMSPPTVTARWPSIEEVDRSGAISRPISELPFRTDLREAIRLSAVHLTRLFDADKDDEPYFCANLRADGTGELVHYVNIGIPHVTGRCLLGVLLAEKTIALNIEPNALAVLERYHRASFDNEDSLNSYYDPARGGARFVEFHNLREGLYGLVVLMRVRNSEWAKSTAQKMIHTLVDLTDPDGKWSADRAIKLGMADRCEGLTEANAARLVEPLLEYHQLTGDPVSLALAQQYAEVGLRTLFEPDGTFAEMERSSGHVHSITSSLAGITRLALFLEDRETIDACRRILDVGVPEYFSTWGWGDEVYPDHSANEVGRGEINQTGDVIRAALALGLAGHTRYLDLAERYMRSMVMPTQHREAELRAFMRENLNPSDDSEFDVLNRSIGGFAMQLPNDRMQEGAWPITTLDITSGAVHAMCDFHKAVLTGHPFENRVNLMLSCGNPDFDLVSHLPRRGLLDITAHTSKTLSIRFPEWVRRLSVRVRVGEFDKLATWVGDTLVVACLTPGVRAQIEFDVACKAEREIVDGTEYSTTWVGSQVVEILPRGAVSPLPF